MGTTYINIVWLRIGSVHSVNKTERVFGLEVSQNSKLITQKHNSFLKTLSHSKPKTEKNCLAPISQNWAPHLSPQFFHFLVEPIACTGQKVGFLFRVSSSLSFHPILFCLPISTNTHAEPKRKVWAFFFSYNKSFYFANFQVCENEKLCTDSLLFQILSSPPITL